MLSFDLERPEHDASIFSGGCKMSTAVSHACNSSLVLPANKNKKEMSICISKLVVPWDADHGALFTYETKEATADFVPSLS